MSAYCNGVVQACSYSPGVIVAEPSGDSKELVSVSQFGRLWRVFRMLGLGAAPWLLNKLPPCIWVSLVRHFVPETARTAVHIPEFLVRDFA